MGPMICAPALDARVGFLRGIHHDPTAPRTPSGMSVENLSVIFGFSFQTTNRPEVRTVTGFCGCFLNFEKFRADVELSALSHYLWAADPEFTPTWLIGHSR